MRTRQAWWTCRVKEVETGPGAVASHPEGTVARARQPKTQDVPTRPGRGQRKQRLRTPGVDRAGGGSAGQQRGLLDIFGLPSGPDVAADAQGTAGHARGQRPRSRCGTCWLWRPTQGRGCPPPQATALSDQGPTLVTSLSPGDPVPRVPRLGPPPGASQGHRGAPRRSGLRPLPQLAAVPTEAPSRRKLRARAGRGDPGVTAHGQEGRPSPECLGGWRARESDRGAGAERKGEEGRACVQRSQVKSPGVGGGHRFTGFKSPETPSPPTAGPRPRQTQRRPQGGHRKRHPAQGKSGG